MKIIRKALLPAVIAAGFLGFLGAVGTSVPTVSAAPGDVCEIEGPTFIEEGSTHDYFAYIEDAEEYEYTEVDVDLNDFDGGDSDITSLFGEDLPSATDFLNDVDIEYGENVCGDDDLSTVEANKPLIRAWLLEAIDRGEVCSGTPPSDTPLDCTENAFAGHRHPNDTNPGGLTSWQDGDIDCGLVGVLGEQCSISNSVITAMVNALAEAVADGDSCADIAMAGEDAALLAGATEFVAGQLDDLLVNSDDCGDIPGDESPSGNDGWVQVDVTCDDPGVFDLSFAVKDGGSASIEVVCGSDALTAEIFSRPSSVEINPSLANVAHSLIWIEVKGDNGEPAFPGTEVMWTTDRCAIESSTVNSEAEFEAANTGASGIFNNLNALNPATAFAVEQSTFAQTAPDSASRQQEEDVTFTVTQNSDPGTERTISAVILHCDPIHSPNVTPGPAVVTAFIERGDGDIDDEDVDDDTSDNDDLVVRTTVTVVGPPAANGVTVTAAPSTLACGEKATITVDVKDSIGQPVSDHTWVEAVTNAGGVLAGTGAVAGQQGLVSPVSSTVAETFGGKATLYLLTSTAHVGKYEVVITTGGGGGVTGQLLQNGGVTTNLLGGLFTTAPISVQVTIECTVPTAAPQPAPNTSGPQTGQGITPPSTGDAGLASTESSWVAGTVVAVIAALVVAGFSVKLVREE